VAFVDSAGGKWQVTAEALSFDLDTGRMVLERGVQVTAPQDDIFFSVNHLVYEPDTRKLIGEDRVRFREGANRVSARRIVVNTRTRVVTFAGVQAYLDFTG
jgi:hypothetical protein